MKKSIKNKLYTYIFISIAFFIMLFQIQSLLELDTTYLGEKVDTHTLYYFLGLIVLIPFIVYVILYKPVLYVYTIIIKCSYQKENKQDIHLLTIQKSIWLKNPFDSTYKVLRC